MEKSNNMKYYLLENEQGSHHMHNQSFPPPCLSNPEAYQQAPGQPYPSAPGQPYPSAPGQPYPSSPEAYQDRGQTFIQQQPPITVQPIHQTHVVGLANAVTVQPTSRIWTAGLCDCCNDCGVCLCVTCFTWCVMCGLAKRMNENCCIGYCYGGLAQMRTKYRLIHRIQGSLCEDACLSYCCCACVMCQLSREMTAEGYEKTCYGCS